MSINKKELTDIVYTNMGFHRTESTNCPEQNSI
jgi:hypothetical protein